MLFHSLDYFPTLFNTSIFEKTVLKYISEELRIFYTKLTNWISQRFTLEEALISKTINMNQHRLIKCNQYSNNEHLDKFSGKLYFAGHIIYILIEARSYSFKNDETKKRSTYLCMYEIFPLN